MLTEKILKRISLMTGLSLLIMAVIAPIALFMGLNPVYAANDAVQTLNNLLGANNPLGWIGVHLLLLGVLIFRSRQFNKILGILVSLAGSAYFIDSLGQFLVPDYGLSLASYLFFGEVLFIGWLIWRGIVGFKAA